MSWTQFLHYVYDNKLAIIATFGAIATAGVVTMPSPDRPWWNAQTAKEWLYDFLHQFINSKNTRNKQDPTQPPAK
jgi:hypothetical protein